MTPILRPQDTEDSGSLGALFRSGWTPCFGPTLATVQVLAFDEARRGVVRDVPNGLGIPFVAVALAYRRAAGALGWFRRTNTRSCNSAGRCWSCDFEGIGARPASHGSWHELWVTPGASHAPRGGCVAKDAGRGQMRSSSALS